MSIYRGPDDWSPEHVHRFWDFYASHEERHTTYFGYLGGAALVQLLDLLDLVHGKILDFGCGPGLILERIARRPVEAYGIDASEKSIAAAHKRCQGLPGFRDAIVVPNGPTPWPDASFDLVLCCEIVEHVVSPVAAEIYAEAQRLLKPGGHLFISTPANEDLNSLTVYCPFCESEFHRWQHMRSMSPAGLREELAAAGFDVLSAEAIDLMAFDPAAVLTRAPRCRRLVSYCWRRALKLLKLLAPAKARETERWLRTFPGPHLVALARKRGMDP